jgi:hypothetical protein
MFNLRTVYRMSANSKPTQNPWVFGLHPSSSIPKTRKHNEEFFWDVAPRGFITN